MIKIKKILTSVMVMLFTLFTVFSYLPTQAAMKPTVVPQIQFANAPVTEYKVGDRVGFNIHSPNYGGRVEYRVVLWNDSKKSYSDLWYPSNGYPTSYYTKWQPYGNNIFTLGWIINEPGSYRITVYAKRVGIPNSKTALKGMNCDSYKESVAFRVRANEATIQSILPVADITVNQGVIPTLPSTVKAVMNDATEKTLKVTWGLVDTTNPGTFIIPGTVEGTNLKASQRLIVNPIQTTLNVYSVEAGTINTVNVNLRASIGFTPALSRFSLSGYGASNLRLYTLNMSADKKIIQLSTDTLTLGNWYTLKVDGTEYVFQVPYNIGSGSKVTLTARDIIVQANTSMSPDITVYPNDAVLSFTSYDPTIARYDSYTRKIVGVKAGTTIFNVVASKTGLISTSETFSVTVRGSSLALIAAPTVLQEAVANNGSLVSGEITVTSSYEYFRPDINTTNVLVYNLPQGLSYSVTRTNSTTLKIYITGYADNHSYSNDTLIHVTVLNGLYGGSDYLISNDVLIDFIDAPAPAAPTFTISPTTVTNGDVTVTVDYPSGATEKMYKIGASGSYQSYTVPFSVTQNTTVYAKYKNSSGVQSVEGSYNITNIDKTIPQDPIITINPATPTNSSVAVTITYPTDAVVRQYKIGNGEYLNYTSAFPITSNTTIYAKCQNQAGNWSSEVSLAIVNIDKIKPPKPTLTPNTTDPTNANVTVTIANWGDAVVKKYKIDNGEWLDCTDSVVMTNNGTIYVQGTDAAGNKSAVASLVISNIDKTIPTILSAKFTSFTTVEIKFSENVVAAVDCFKDGKFNYKFLIDLEGDFIVTNVNGSGSDTIILQISENDAIGDISSSTTGKITVTSGVKDAAGNALSEITFNIARGSF